MTEVQEAAAQTAAEKFMKDLKMKERRVITTQLGVGFSGMDSSHDDGLACGMLYTAARRLKRDEITWDSIDELKGEELGELLEECLTELGFEDDEEDEEVPLVSKTSEDESSSVSPKKKS